MMRIMIFMDKIFELQELIRDVINPPVGRGNLSQNELANRIGISQGTIQKILFEYNGIADLKFSTVKLIAQKN